MVHENKSWHGNEVKATPNKLVLTLLWNKFHHKKSVNFVVQCLLLFYEISTSASNNNIEKRQYIDTHAEKTQTKYVTYTIIHNSYWFNNKFYKTHAKNNRQDERRTTDWMSHPQQSHKLTSIFKMNFLKGCWFWSTSILGEWMIVN